MKRINPSSTGDIHNPNNIGPSGIRTTGREYVNPVDYKHPYESMKNYACTAAN